MSYNIVTSGKKWEKVVKMYFGSYEHSLDNKGRLLIPSRLKDGLSEGSALYIMQGFDGCLSVYNQNGFDELTKKCSSLSYQKKASRDYLRTLLSSVTPLYIDKVGRVQLPAYTLNKYQIGKEVMIIGVGDHFEIWDLKKFQEYQKDAQSHFEEIAENLDTKDE